MFDALFGNNMPTYNAVPLDKGTVDTITGQVSTAGQGPGALADKLNSGVSDSSKLIGGASGFSQNPNMLQAIRNQYNQLAGRDISRIQNQNRFQAPMMNSQMLNQATTNAMAMRAVSNRNYANLVQANNDYQIARAGALSGALGAIGGPIGEAMAIKTPRKRSDRPFENYGEETMNGPEYQGESYDYGDSNMNMTGGIQAQGGI